MLQLPCETIPSGCISTHTNFLQMILSYEARYTGLQKSSLYLFTASFRAGAEATKTKHKLEKSSLLTFLTSDAGFLADALIKCLTVSFWILKNSGKRLQKKPCVFTHLYLTAEMMNDRIQLYKKEVSYESHTHTHKGVHTNTYFSYKTNILNQDRKDELDPREYS